MLHGGYTGVTLLTDAILSLQGTKENLEFKAFGDV
jgi:hypothetical protein